MSEKIETALPDLGAQVEFCRRAEDCGIDSLLTAFGYYMPDPIILATAIGMATTKIKFMIAYRSGIISPVVLVQQLNTLSALVDGRLNLNVVAGHSPAEQRSYGDFLPHDERYHRTEEFLAICNALWRRDGGVNFRGTYYQVENAAVNTPFISKDRTAPEIFIGGNSERARELAISQGNCWLRFADTPQALWPVIEPVLARGVEVGLRCGVIVRPTHREAVQAAAALVAGSEAQRRARAKEEAFVRASDASSMKADYQRAEREQWLTPNLWVGAVPAFGPAAAALVGTPDEVATAIMEYNRVGVTQFVLSGWPKLDEMVVFGEAVLPRVRANERQFHGDVPDPDRGAT